jgi:tRNA pseudouridine38-40 synthase
MVSGVLLTVAYDGTDFHDYAVQPDARTVARELLQAVRMIDPEVAFLRGVSRTDAGVHARGQRVSFNTSRDIPPRGWVLGLNRHLPRDLVVRHAGQVPADYDPRDHAVAKHYRYTLLVDRRRDPFWERYSWRMTSRFDRELARQEAAALVGTHDFAAFRSAADSRTSTERTIFELTVTTSPRDDRLVLLDIHGSAFLHNMVRIIAGTLADVARGRLAPGACARALLSGERAGLGTTAQPQGLCLQSVRLEPDAAGTWPGDAARGP